MAELIGVHVISTTYGTWLPGDARGHWSPMIQSDGTIIYPAGGPLPGDSNREAQARKLMKEDPVFLSRFEQAAVATAFQEVTRSQNHLVYAATVCANHFHLVLAAPSEPLGRVIGRYKGVAGGAVRWHRGSGSVWTDGYYKVYLFSESQMIAAIEYVERHNLDRGLPIRWNWVINWRGLPNEADLPCNLGHPAGN